MLKAIKLLLGLLLFSIILISSLLFSGIKINSLSFGNIVVSQFYIKLDKKLIVDIESIKIKSKKSTVSNSYEDLKKNIELFPKILKIFEKIDIRKLVIDGNEFTIALNKEALYLDNKFINISSRLDFNANEITFDVYSLYLKDIDLMFDGKVKVDYYKESLNLFGKYYYKDIKGDITLDMTRKLANFYLNSNEFESLSFLKKFFRLDSIAEAWMYDNVRGGIKLKEFYGSFDLEKNKIIEKSLKASAVIKNAKIKFHKNAKQIFTEQIDIGFKNDKLTLDLVKPVYEKINLDGSYVYISNLTSEKKGLVEVNIKARKAKLDNRILDVLKNYNINLPLTQKTGFTNANVNLKIPYSADKKMQTKGKFVLVKSDIDLNNFEFSTKKATVLLDNTIVKIIDANIKHKNMLEAILNFEIDTEQSTALGNTFIKSFLIQDDNREIINIKDVKTPLFFSYKNDIKINLEALNIDVNINDFIYVDIKNLDSIYNYSKLLQDINIKNGNLFLKIKNKNDISFDSYITNLDFPLQQNDEKINSLKVRGFINKDYVKVNTLDEKIKVQIKDKETFVSLKDIDILIDSKKQNDKKLPLLNLSVKNSKLKLHNEVYNLTSAKAKISTSLISFDADLNNLNIPLQKDGKKVDNLSIKGTYSKNIATIQTVDKKIKIKATDSNKLDIHIKDYDVLVNTLDDEKSKISDLNIEGENSSIIINDKFKFLAENFTLRIRDDDKYFHLNHKETDFTFKESKDKKIDIFASDISDIFINTIFDKKILSGNNMQFLANGTPESIKGKMILKDVKIEDLAILNNLLLFINTSPALINPLLAIPSVVGMATNGGFNLTGYKVIDGLLEFNYHQDKKTLDINRVSTVGNGIDFDGNGKIDLNTQTIDSNINLIFLKDYSKVVGAIPIVNYVLLGDDKRVETKVNIFGALNNPKISTNLTKDAFSVPLNIAKRVLTSPVDFVNFIKNLGNKSKEEEK